MKDETAKLENDREVIFAPTDGAFEAKASKMTAGSFYMDPEEVLPELKETPNNVTMAVSETQEIQKQPDNWNLKKQRTCAMKFLS